MSESENNESTNQSVVKRAPGRPPSGNKENKEVSELNDSGDKPYKGKDLGLSKAIFSGLVDNLFNSMDFDQIKTLKADEANNIFKHLVNITEIAIHQFEKKF